MGYNKKNYWRLAFLGICLTFLLISCRQNNLSQNTELTISAAASLKDALETIKPLYEQKHPQTTITYNFASSGSLQRQIEQGAAVDVFLAAASQQMDTLQNKGLLLKGTRQNLLENQMVLIVPQDNQTINSFADLTTEAVKKIALGEPKSVPAGKYAQEILKSLQISTAIQAKVVYGKDVRQVLYYVATGNVDAGIVYLTDATVAPDVKIVAIAPESSHSAIVYPVAVVKDSANPEVAKELVEFLFSAEAKAVFEEYGFEAN
ncbi:MAG: molybdate ABC transporter substrate-binding protein [Spirulinaceae cyanobacterium]